MKKALIIMGMGVLITSISGCGARSNEAGTESESSVVEMQTSVDVTNTYTDVFRQKEDTNDYLKNYTGSVNAGAKIVDKPEGNTYIYNSEPIAVTVKGNASFDTTLGYLIFINGIPQKYYTDKESSKEYIHSEPANEGSDSEMTLYIEPDKGQAGEKLELTITEVIGAAYRPLGAHDPMQPGCDVRVLGKYTIDMKAAAQSDNTGISDKDIKELEKINYTDYELSQLIKTYSDGSIENQLETVNFRNTYTQSVIENGKLHLFTEFGGAGKGEYIINVYLNGELLRTYRTAIENYLNRAVIDDYVEFDSDMLSRYSVEEYNTICYVAVPSAQSTGDILSVDGIAALWEN